MNEKTHFSQCVYMQLLDKLKLPPEKIYALVRQAPDVLHWGYILHDRDPGRDPHIHVYMQFSSPVTAAKLAARFHETDYVVEVMPDSRAEYWSHMMHKEYSLSDITASFDLPGEIERFRASAAPPKAGTATPPPDGAKPPVVTDGRATITILPE